MATTVLGTLSIPKINAGATGDIFILEDGTYDHTTEEAITKSGITFKARNKHKAIIKGAPIDLKAQAITFQDFDLAYSKSSGDYVEITGSDCILRGNKIHFGNNPTECKWITVNATNVTIEGNEIFGKTKPDDLITVNRAGVKILNNYFHDQTQTVSDTRTECIRIGASSVASKDFNAEIAFNKFERISADVELITIKSCNNNLHDNEFTNCVSSPTFRHGRNNKFVHNTLNGVGLRIYGKGHIIKDNTFKRNPNKQLLQIIIGNGQYAEEELNTSAGYTQVRDLTFENNYIDNKDGTSDYIVCWGYSSYPLKPTNNKFLNNTITATKGTLANTRDGASWNGNTVTGNILWVVPGSTGKYGDMPIAGYTKKDPGTVIPTPPTPTPIPPTEPTPTPPQPTEPPLTLEQRVARLEKQVFGNVYPNPA